MFCVRITPARGAVSAELSVRVRRHRTVVQRSVLCTGPLWRPLNRSPGLGWSGAPAGTAAPNRVAAAPATDGRGQTGSIARGADPTSRTAQRVRVSMGGITSPETETELKMPEDAVMT